MSTHTNSPDHTPIQPLRNSSLAAQVVASSIAEGKNEFPSCLNDWDGPLRSSSFATHVSSIVEGEKEFPSRLNDWDGPHACHGLTSEAAPLAKKGPTFSPTDTLLTPCTKILRTARKKHFNKPHKTVQLFLQAENKSNDELQEEPVSEQVAVPTEIKMEDDDENPF